MTKLLTWSELQLLPVGTALVFPEPGHDIYPHCVVKAGTFAIKAGNSAETIDVLPADPEVCRVLDEWNGCVSFSPLNDGYSWDDPSPVALFTNL